MREPGGRRQHPEQAETPSLLKRIGTTAATLGRSGPKRKSVRILLQGALTALIFGLLVYTVVSQWSEIRSEGVEFNLLWVVPALALIAIYYLGAAFLWGLVLRLLGSPVSAAQAQRIWAQPLLVRYIPGTVLFVFARILMAERVGVSRRVSVAGLAYEQAATICGALTVSAWFLVAHPDLGGYPLRWLTLLVFPLAAILLHPRVFGPLTGRILTALGREPLPQLMRFRDVMAIYLVCIGLWAVMGLGVFCAARSAHFLALDDLATVAAAQSIGFLASVVSAVTPAGLGVRDASFAWAMKTALPSGSFSVAAALALTVRAIQTVAELIYIAGVSLLTRRSGSAPAGEKVDRQPG